MAADTPSRWSLGDAVSICWAAGKDPRRPHEDFIEQGGLGAGQVVRYRVDADGQLGVRRHIVWPSLRKLPNDTYGSLMVEYGAEAEPAITVDGRLLPPLQVDTVVLDGTLRFLGTAAGLDIERTTCCCRERRAVLDLWRLRNAGTETVTVRMAPLALSQETPGPYGPTIAEVWHDAPSEQHLAGGESTEFAVVFAGRLAAEPAEPLDPAAELATRRAWVTELQRNLEFVGPDAELNTAFAFAKQRVAEGINATRGGLMLAPGGLRYYAAMWCNDNVEYAGPFFPFLGDGAGNQASLDTYRAYRRYMNDDYGFIPWSIIAAGTDTYGPFDRGDAAMYAYGCARYCLALGDAAVARELWPAIVWCLEFCRRQLTADGVVASDSDELEGRFPTGTANLSTSTLAYGAWRSAADLGRALGHAAAATAYDAQADALGEAIERYFGARVEGFDTYRYYDGNDVLRAWICLPLCMGLLDRAEQTIAALFSPRLWTADGLATQAGDQTFWDRSTLYGLRGVFQAGATERALDYLRRYTRRRLLGEHVPYAVEAWPEGGQAHLAAESGLYCRIITEGLFGLLPTGFGQLRCTPRLPADWPSMELRSIRAFGRCFDLRVTREGQHVTVAVVADGHTVVTTVPPAGTVALALPER